MNSDPFVSIIIPFYNAEKNLKASIESALSQTYKEKEIILIDDGSTDSSKSIALNYSNTSVITYSQKNKGASSARNLGLSKAKGDFIQFLDADDLLSPQKIELQVMALKNAPEKVALCSTIHFFDGEDPLQAVPSPFDEKFLESCNDPAQFLIKLWGGYHGEASMVQPNAWLSPRSVIERAGLWNESLTLDDDGEYFARVVLQSKGVLKVAHIYNYYRKYGQLQQNLSAGKTLKHFNSQLSAAIVKKKELLTRNNSEEAKVAIHRQFFEIILKSYPAFPDIYLKAMQEQPVIHQAYSPPPLGGFLIEKLSHLFGWKLARKIQYWRYGY